MRRSELIMFGLLITMLIPLEIISAYLAYETLGEIISTLYFLALSVNLLFLILAWRYPAWAAGGVITLALAIIPYQLLLGYRLFRAQAEATRIVVYQLLQKSHTNWSDQLARLSDSRFPASF